jgi:hypothetical protein
LDVEHGILKLQGRLGCLKWNGWREINLPGAVKGFFWCDYEEINIKDSKGKTSVFRILDNPTQMEKNGFKSNWHRLPVPILPVTGNSAILLRETAGGTGRYTRIGLVEFERAVWAGKHLSELADGSDEETIEIE